ncbi:hypothetical protein KSP40_PGU007905 [Platanthera guangdongensis]|uniref:Uncharacterized protein n=1 Tax=Platanthera guangdongensis TaxID=2320717 RepID=A0ABR2LPW8_9ASPA
MHPKGSFCGTVGCGSSRCDSRGPPPWCDSKVFPYLLKRLAEFILQLPRDGKKAMLGELYVQRSLLHGPDPDLLGYVWSGGVNAVSQVFPYLLKRLAEFILQLPRDGKKAMLGELYVQVAESDDVTRKPLLVSWLHSLSYLCEISPLNNGVPMNGTCGQNQLSAL